MITLNLQMVRGKSKVWSWQVLTDGIPAGDPGGGLAITGASIWMTAKSAFTDTDAAAVFQLTVGSGITITTASEFVTQPTADQTESLSRTVAKVLLKYDIAIRFSDGSGPFPLARGDLTVYTNVTLAPNE